LTTSIYKITSLYANDIPSCVLISYFFISPLFTSGDLEVLDEFGELGGSGQLDDELGLLASSDGRSISFGLFIFRSDGGGLYLSHSGVSASAEEFTDFNSDADGITQSMEFNIIEIHKEELREEDIESRVSRGGDLDFVASGLKFLFGFS